MNMKWIVGFTAMLLIAGLIAGIIIAGINPWVSPAEARQMDAATQYQQKQYELALLEEQVRIDAEAKQAEQDLFQDQEEHAQSLVLRQKMAEVGIILLIIFVGALSIGVVIFAIRMALPKKSASAVAKPEKEAPEVATSSPVYSRPIPVRVPYDPWKDPKYRENMVKQARDNEQQFRRVNNVCKTNNKSNNGYYRLPRAG